MPLIVYLDGPIFTSEAEDTEYQFWLFRDRIHCDARLSALDWRVLFFVGWVGRDLLSSKKPNHIHS